MTIYDIARLSRVSVTTVSKILNHKDFDISDETRERVLKVIKETDFTPNGLARSLVTKKTHVVGLMIPDISNQYFADMARGAENRANSLGYNIILCNTDESTAKELEYLRILKDKSVDGIIIVPVPESKEQFLSEFDCEKPFVLLDRDYENMSRDIYQVKFANIKGGYLATQYLLNAGHRRIGLITASTRNRPSRNRMAGYQMALEQAGVKMDDSIIYEGNQKYESGIKGAEYLLSKGVTAIFAMNDLMATGAYKAILAQGLKIPEDISVMGYDDITISELLDPPLTTIIQPRIEMGQVAATMLIHQIKNEKSETEVVFEPSIAERKSIRSL